MLANIKTFLKNASESGLRLPFSFDPVRNAPSVTLFFAYMMFIIMACSLVALHFYSNLFVATVTTIATFFGCLSFYIIRTISRIKFDLDDRSFELEDSSQKETK